MLAPYRCRLLLLCGIGVWRYLQIAIENCLHLFLCPYYRTMVKPTLDTYNKPQNRMERFKEFCSLPASRIAESPLGMFNIANGWFEIAFRWLFDNPVTQWMSEIRYNHPKRFWISSVLWIPLSIVFYFYAFDLLLIGAFFIVAIIISSAIILAVICKVCHMFFVITSKPVDC